MENLRITIEKSNKQKFMNAFNVFVDKAKRMKLQIPTIVSATESQIMQKIIVDGVGDNYFIDVISYELNIIETFKFSGWSVIGTVYFSEGMVDLVDVNYTFPEYLGLGYKKCDHCGHNHSNRIKSFIIADESGNYRQVGSDCIKDFTGVSVSILNKLQAMLNIVTDFNFDDYEGDGMGAGRRDSKFSQYLLSRKAYDYFDIICFAKMVFDVDGKYIKKEYEERTNRFGQRIERYRINEGKATVDKIEKLVDNKAHFDSIDGNYFANMEKFLLTLNVPCKIQHVYSDEAKYDITLDPNNYGYNVIETTEEDEDSFEYKLKSLVGVHRIRRGDFWKAACAIQAYEKHLETLRRIEAGKSLKHIGVVGQKVSFRATVVDYKSGEGAFGTWTLYLMVDEAGNKISKFGVLDNKFVVSLNTNCIGEDCEDENCICNTNRSVQIGDVIMGTAEVKKHEERMNAPVTQIGRIGKYNPKLKYE
jgi:hypothetical protein